MLNKLSKNGAMVQETTLANGTTVRVNDHVYLLPEHHTEPYYIGRIMEFVKLPQNKELQARIAWFYRLKDVFHRKHYDSRQLVATMHSDLNPVSSIRGKCVVTHQHYITDLDAYRHLDDHFYYSQLLDRYIQRLFEVLPCETVRNVPMHISKALRERYQYIVVEPSKAADFTTAHVECTVCGKWCASNEALRCVSCNNNYHLSCLNPPIAKKPSKGFAWQCAWCSKKDLDRIAQNTAAGVMAPAPPDPHPSTGPATPTRISRQATPTPESNRSSPATSHPTPSGRRGRHSLGQKHKKCIVNRTTTTETMSHGWPFRYFGIHCHINDILDDDDRIYPRAASRIGTKYQAVVPDWCETNSSQDAATPSFSMEKSGRSRKSKVEKGASKAKSSTPIEAIPVRGTEETVEVIYKKPDDLPLEIVENYMDTVKNLSLPLPPYSVDLLDRALHELQKHEYKVDTCLSDIRALTAQDLGVVDWTREEIDAFENAVRTYGHEITRVARFIPTKKVADVVRFFYRWKKTDRYELVYSEYTKIHKPQKKFKRRNADGSYADNLQPMAIDSGSESEDPTVAPSHWGSAHQCANCLTTTSTIWRRAPPDTIRKTASRRKPVLCDVCGMYWLKHGEPRPVELESSKGKKNEGRGGYRRRKENDTPNRKKEKRSHSPSPPPPSPCSVCGILEAKSNPLLTCHDCGLSVHTECYGVSSKPQSRWICDMCKNDKEPVVSTSYSCVLCRKPWNSPHQALKKTAGNNWAHVLCAIWMPEVKFGNTASLEPVECIGMIHTSRWKQTCCICHATGGATVSCDICRKAVHSMCAMEAKWKVAFEMQPVKSTKQVTVIGAGHFAAGGGWMVPRVWCPEHDTGKLRIVNIHEVDNETGHSAIHTYVTQYKHFDTSSTGAMRKARLVTSAQSSRRLSVKRQVEYVQRHTCRDCGTDASPYWWDYSESENTPDLPGKSMCVEKLCHLCWWSKTHSKSLS
ncbi:uncharacterized protein VTP21DRAFT_8413 [Calcarisporiella thermophila]|uniref:uncharacterized protein n=1 Tax=Calcarisporiella thermophila TaxID=911321 RepID=UPI003743C56B